MSTPPCDRGGNHGNVDVGFILGVGGDVSFAWREIEAYLDTRVLLPCCRWNYPTLFHFGGYIGDEVARRTGLEISSLPPHLRK